MEKDPYYKLFETLPAVTAQGDLPKRIIIALETAQKKEKRMQFFAWGTVALASFAGFVPGILYAIRGFNSSGFVQYASLMFTDSSVVLSHWQAFGLSLSESFPVMQSAIALGTCVMFLWAVRKIVETVGKKSITSAPAFAL